MQNGSNTNRSLTHGKFLMGVFERAGPNVNHFGEPVKSHFDDQEFGSKRDYR